jgi:RNA polymerase sigma-70 factor (ECF subfamily)
MVGVQEWSAVGERPRVPGAEAALLSAGQSGDRAAIEELLAPHKGALLALCCGILGHREDGEDAAQETVLRALRALPRFRGEATFRTWLLRIAVNVCINWKRDRRPAEPLEELCADHLPGALSPEAIALRRLQVLEALSTLRPRHRAVLLLKEREGWSMTEIGAALGWNEKRVENELYRARRALVEWRRRNAENGDER